MTATNIDIDRIAQEYFDDRESEFEMDEVFALAKQNCWISVNDFLPEERENPITMDFYEYPVTYQNGDVRDVRYYKFGNGHWWHGPEVMDEYVTAWMMIPEPYHSCEKLTKEEVEDLLCVGGLTAELEVKEIGEK